MNASMCYIGRTSCGCIVTVTVDRPEYQKENAKDIAKWMRDGLTIERMSVEDVRGAHLGCVHKKPKVKKRRKTGQLPLVRTSWR